MDITSREGFVLAGGRSSRMGSDKARLPLAGESLLARVATTVAAAAGSATLIGDPARYADLGFPVTPDTFPGLGPLAGIHAALQVSRSDWNLIVACDMPDLETLFLRSLLDAAAAKEADCLLPAGPSGRPEPLCGIYHRHCLPEIEKSLQSGVRKVLDGLRALQVEILQVTESHWFRNINTPADWSDYQHSTR